MNPGPALPIVALIEDDAAQLELVELAMAEAGLNAHVHAICDGKSGLDQLRRWVGGEDDGTRAPTLVLLDIKLPRLSGIEILEALKADARPVPFPIVMLTSSKMPDDLISSFSNGAVSYFVKPMGFHELVRLMDTIGRRWLDTALTSD